MLLDDLACGAGREGIAAARQIGTGHRLGDRRHFRGHIQTLRIDERVVQPRLGHRAGARGGARAVHAEHRQHIADAIDHRNHRWQVAARGFAHRLGDDLLDFGHGQRFLRRRGEIAPRWRRGGIGRRRRAGRGRGAAAIAAPAGAQHQRHCRQRCRNLANSHHARTLRPDATRPAIPELNSPKRPTSVISLPSRSYCSDRMVRTAPPSARRNSSGL